MKVAIITGATSGIGWEAAKQIDERFASLDEIWLIGRKEGKLLELSKQLKHSVRTFAMDLCLDKDREEFSNFLKKAKPNIRMLFQSAGVGLHGWFAQRKTEDSLEMIRINCEALTYMCSICIPYMKATVILLICRPVQDLFRSPVMRYMVQVNPMFCLFQGHCGMN